MIDEEMQKHGTQSDEMKEKRKPGRKPMTAEQKEEAAKLRRDKKEKASNMKPEIIMQFQGAETDLGELAELAKSDFHAKRKRTLITSLRLYIKPEERTAYYVVNETYTGQVQF